MLQNCLSTRIRSISICKILNSWAMLCFLILIPFSESLAWGGGNVTFSINNRGDISVIGDNFNNKLAIYLDFEFPQEVVIEGIGGTTITIVEPGFPSFTDSIIYLDRNGIDFVRSLTLNLREGNNEAFISYLPVFIFGDFRVDLGRGRNNVFINLEEAVDVVRSISVRGSRSASDSSFILFGSNFNGDIFARQLSLDIGGDNTLVSIAGLQTWSNVSATTRGNNASLVFGEAIVQGRTNLQNRGSFGGLIDLYFADLIGRTSIQSRGNDGLVFVEKNLFFSDVNLRVGNFGNQVALILNEFLSPRRSRLQAGRGENTLFSNGNFFQTPPDFRGFTIIE